MAKKKTTHSETYVKLPTEELEALRDGLPKTVSVAVLAGIEEAIAENARPDRDALIAEAQNLHCDDEVMVDDNATFSDADDATWVSAWVRVPRDDADEEGD